MISVWATVRTYKSYLFFIFVPYVVLIGLFHSQLHGGSTNHHHPDDVQHGVVTSSSHNQLDTFRLRELQLEAAGVVGLHDTEPATRVKSLNLMLLLKKPVVYLHGVSGLNVSMLESWAGQRKHTPEGTTLRSLTARQAQKDKTTIRDLISNENDDDNVRDNKTLKQNSSDKDMRIAGSLDRNTIVATNTVPAPQLSLIYKAYKDLGHKLANTSLLQVLANGLAGPEPVVRDGPGFPAQSHCSHTQSVLQDSGRFHPMQGNYLYSAFYDDRRSDTRRVLLIALLKKISKPAMFCHFRASNSSKQMHSVPVTDYYEMCENHAKDYGGWMLSCDIPLQVKGRPCEVTVSLHSNPRRRKMSSVLLPVFTLYGRWSHKRDFGVCVPPLFGYIPSTTLIEFVELTQLLGAGHLVVYLQQVSREVHKVLRYYQQLGVVTVLPWDLPVPERSIWYHGQLLAINDCLYRGMHAFKYLTFNDIDEFVVPHGGATNWTSMIEAIQGHSVNQPHSKPGMTFQSAFFDPLMTVGSSRALYDLESDLRTKSFSHVRTKVMVDPTQIHELGIHHISKPLNESNQPDYVQPETAFIHHYRKCVTDFDPKMNCQVFARDESLSDYIPTLRHNVHQTLWILKEMDKYFPDHQHYYR